jgi:hypothetical protein
MKKGETSETSGALQNIYNASNTENENGTKIAGENTYLNNAMNNALGEDKIYD